MAITAAKPSEQSTGWDQAFDQQAADADDRKGEKPVHILNARQLEYVAHLKRAAQKEKRELV